VTGLTAHEIAQMVKASTMMLIVTLKMIFLLILLPPEVG